MGKALEEGMGGGALGAVRASGFTKKVRYN
jgi:hypothetical protein